MVHIGYRPIIWHLMKRYAHYGHNEFILCLGYRGDYIRRYFLDYNETLSNDFTLSGGGKKIELFSSDIEDWKITFVDTGLHSNVGERLLKVRHLVENEEMFMANYSDGLSDVDLGTYLDFARNQGKTACFLAVRPTDSFHFCNIGDKNIVSGFMRSQQTDLRINGGFHVFRNSIYDYIENGEMLEEEPFRRLVAAEQLVAYKHNGFWACMDTFKDKQMFDEMFAKDNTPWLPS
jgi:glucose-1-phosphate cytidylyltransferase